jgi:Flp pilus assembly protein TadB
MILGALCGALACLAALEALLGPATKPAVSASELIRTSTLSPAEWRMHQDLQRHWYERWLRPLLLLWGSRLHLRPARIDPLSLIQAGVDPERLDGVELRLIRLISALVGATIGAALAFLVSSSLALVPLLAWLGYIAPLRVLASARRRRQAAVQRDLPELISMIRAFMTAGMPLERTLHVLSTNCRPDTVLKQEIRAALARYGLGSSIEHALQEIGPRTGVDDVSTFVTGLIQSRRAGGGLEAALRDHELVAQMNQRNRATTQAAAVSTKMLGVLGGIYLPQFVILIIIPLFWGIMQRAFG